MSNPKHKNGMNSKPKQPALRQHLLTKIIKNHHQQPQVSDVVQCKYGIFCAHLRSEGKCSFPHRKNHYHFLNLVAPIDCLEDEDEEGKVLSKRQKKQKKIIEKTITSQIDVAALDHKEQLIKNKADSQAKKQLINMLQEAEKKVIELLQSASASEFYQRLNGVDKEEVFETKRKAMIQIRKKKQDLFNQIIDKEYRIANRLIKASLKSKDEQLYQLYQSINHDTIPSIRQYFDSYFIQNPGIPQQKPQKTLFQTTPSLYLENIHFKAFFLQPQEYIHQYYFLKSQQSPPISLMANTIFYNMLVPFKMYKEMAYNVYFFVDCQENLTFNRLSNYLNKQYMATFYGKMKAPPEFSFGQGEQNKQKFVNWANKILQKFKESKTAFKVVLLLNNIQSLFPEDKLQEFESEKVRERQIALLSLVEVFNPSIIFILKEVTIKVKENISELLSIEPDSLGENMLKM